mmetsp:Transcript_3118/g.6275  ORF Transcript_3118/g.6275 Transcript_3118/m.6275 type:complete len:397 (-) Transcript_3118:10-1200(-)
MISVTGVCQVKISGFKEVDDRNGSKTLEKDIHAILLAGQHFIGQTDQDIEHAVASTLEGHQRSILGTLTVEELSQDRASFSSKVRELANEDLRSMGMEIVSYTIASLTDDEGYLTSLGVTQTAQVKKLALLGECTNKNEAKQHKAEQELRAQIKINQAQKEIEQSSRDVQVTQAKLREEINVANARADAAKLFEEAKLKQAIVEEEIKQQVVKASIEVDVETEKVRRRRMELEATVQAQAEADLFKKLKEAEGLRQYAEAEAHRIRIVGEAEAEALRNREMVEVDMLRLKAESYKQFGQAALAVQMIEAMPEVAKAIAAPLSKTDKIVFMGSGTDGSGPSAMISEVTKSAEMVNETLQSMTGVSLGDMLKGDASLPGLSQVTTPLTLSALASLPTK